MGTLVSETEQIARRAHRCDECHHKIPPGVKYARQFVVDGGDAWTWKMHIDCGAASDHQFNEDGGDYYDNRSPLVEYENDTGEFPGWLRGYWPHVVCRLELWKQMQQREPSK